MLNYLYDKVNKHDRDLEAHDHLCDLVKQRLKSDGFKAESLWSYDNGECDVYAINNKKDALVFEIKLHHSYKGHKKAVKQLDRDYYLFKSLDFDRVFKFYVTYKDNKPHYERVM